MMTGLYLRMILIAGGIALAIAGFAYYHHRVYQAGYDLGFSTAKSKADMREQAIQTDATRRFNEATATAQAKETALRKQIAAIDDRHFKEKQDADAQNAKLRADIAAGTRRLSIPATNTCSVSGPANAGNPGAVAGAGAEARAELTVEAAEFLTDLAGEGDDAIRQSNAVIDRYNALVETCGAPAWGAK